MSQKETISMGSLNERQQTLLRMFVYKTHYAISDFVKYSASRATLKRDLGVLQARGFIESRGELRVTTYILTPLGLLHRPFAVAEYFAINETERNPQTSYNVEIFEILKNDALFSVEEMRVLDRATEVFKSNAKNFSETVYKKELERFVIELSWKSSKIEGNTYSLLDTEKLIRDGVEATGHTREEAVMILNHKKAFAYILEMKEAPEKIISRRGLEDIHRLLVSDLRVGMGLRKSAVGITGSAYKPLAMPSQIEEQVDAFIAYTKFEQNVFARALVALLCESYIQPFEDGNKRTARLFANALLLLEDCAPLSYRNVDETTYKEAMLIFYEQNSLEAFKKIFIEQYIFATENYNIAKAFT